MRRESGSELVVAVLETPACTDLLLGSETEDIAPGQLVVFLSDLKL